MAFSILQDDLNNIEAAKAAGGDIWNSPLVGDFKQRLKSYYRTLHNEQCCYCRKSFTNEAKIVIDIEHVLPKVPFPEYMFTITNLNISCKHCNMNIKKNRTDFVTDLNAAQTNHADSMLYRFVHPNFDDYYAHLKYITVNINQFKFTKYQIVTGSSKGQFTYDYFRLNENEEDSLNIAQGLKTQEELTDKIASEIAKRLKEDLDSL